MQPGWYRTAWRRNVVDTHIQDWDERFMARFDPDAYVGLLREVGAQSAVVNAYSAVGICMYPSRVGHTHAGLARPGPVRGGPGALPRRRHRRGRHRLLPLGPVGGREPAGRPHRQGGRLARVSRHPARAVLPQLPLPRLRPRSPEGAVHPLRRGRRPHRHDLLVQCLLLPSLLPALRRGGGRRAAADRGLARPGVGELPAQAGGMAAGVRVAADRHGEGDQPRHQRRAPELHHADGIRRRGRLADGRPHGLSAGRLLRRHAAGELRQQAALLAHAQSPVRVRDQLQPAAP